MEKLFWSIALPGFGQLLNGRYVKGFVFIALEVLINVLSNFNEIIMLSFQGDIQGAILKADYQWLMFYPCLYFFAMWDAFKDDKKSMSRYAFLPFAFSAGSVTIGLMYSSDFKLFGLLLGPVFLPMLFVLPGLIVGFLIWYLLSYFNTKRST
ncbi:hypothetical protein ACUXCC_003933 [Cytobacillus horneckiae]|uniref:Uncharacterized protein n=1 Tax=Cytobacillus horneckiae TaxID=549687 RepID=A0A2N0Z9T6_9BACI|nr:hypothetical protein [Cytobacillus horneckiae]MBN6888776.1 hypothetical protein [Cytobacillus horneckiae]MEC1155434.1 hypothetical protein [Cytobacillus horneckiae]MED2936514.1 hypothetical protein [Cytobacillus horneckiae]PKG26247.1 hypothetical protein CWS20_25320 [Cytobacillus horneckiae]